MIQYLIAAGIGAILGKNARKKKYARGGTLEQSSRNSFRYRLDSAGKHLDEADTILSRKGDHQGAYGHLVAAHIDGMGMKDMVRRRSHFYKGTPAMEGLLNQFEDVITDLIIHVEDVKDIDGYNPDKALRRIGAAQRILTSVEGEHEKKGQRKMAHGGRLDEEDIKDRLYDMGVDYDELMEQGEDLDAIQDQYLGFVYDPDTNTWGRGYDKGGMIRAFDEQVRELEIDPNDLWDEQDIQSRLVDGGYEWDEGSDDWQYYLDDIEYGVIEDKNGKVIGYLPFDEIDSVVVETYAKGGMTQGHDEMDGLKKGDTIRITRLTDNRRTETPILLTLVRKGKVNKGKRNEQTKYKFENEDGQTFFAYQRDGEEPRFAFGDMGIIVSEDIDFSPKMAHGGKLDLVHVYDDDGSLFGTGSVESMDGDKVLVRFDSQSVKEFDKDKVRPVMAHGGKTQGYNSRLDESLGSRRGAGRSKEQGRKDRRDESEAMERSMGRRKYAAVGSMDKGDRMMAEGGQTERLKKALDVYDDLLERYGLTDDDVFVSEGYGEISWTDAINGKMSKGLFKSPETAYEDVNRYLRREYGQGKKMARGGVTDLATETLKKWNEVHSEKQFNRKIEKNRAFDAFKKSNNVDVKADQRVAKVFVDGDEVGFALLISNTTGKPLKRLKFISSMAKGGKTKRKEVSSFDKLAMKVAARYRAEGKSNEKAMEIGRGTAAKVYREQQAKKGKK
jgi:hypothetical protein